MKRIILSSIVVLLHIALFAVNPNDTVVVKNDSTTAASAPAVVMPEVLIGYIDRAALIELMPGKSDLDAKIKTQRQAYEAEYTRMNTEYNKKVRDYVEKNKTMSEPIKLARQADVTELEKRMVVFKESYNKELAKMRSDGMAPILAAANEAIKLVSQELKLTILFDSGTPLFVSDDCVDILPFVKLKLKL